MGCPGDPWCLAFRLFELQQAVEKPNLAVGPTFESVVSALLERVDRLENLSHILRRVCPIYFFNKLQWLRQ